MLLGGVAILLGSGVFCQSVLAQYGLSLEGAPCGQLKCKIDEYCSEFDHKCAPCSTVCNNTSHNFESALCIKECQDYIHDLRYVRVDGLYNKNKKNLAADVEQLSNIITVTLTLVCLMLVVLAIVLGFQAYRWKLKKHVTLKNLKSKLFKKSESQENKMNHLGTENRAKPDLKLDMTTVSVPISDHSPGTVTTSLSRRPAEDSTLDYAYDNHAMNSSPTINSNRY